MSFDFFIEVNGLPLTKEKNQKATKCVDAIGKIGHNSGFNLNIF
jgi:hypothetical protein